MTKEGQSILQGMRQALAYEEGARTGLPQAPFDAPKFRRHIFSRPIRWLKYLGQRLTRGWDDSELWSLDHTFARWIVPRLQRFKETKQGIPASLLPKLEGASDYTDEQEEQASKLWDGILDDMIIGFLEKQKEFEGDGEYDDAKYENAKTLFARHLDSLWN